MKPDFYKEDEEQFKDVIEELKSLPRAKTPSDFEFNLMTKIHNKNFKLKTEAKEKYTLYGFLKPALSVSVAAVILFFMFSDYSPDVSDPLIAEPELRQEIVQTPDSAPDKKEYIVTEPKSVADANDDAQKPETTQPTSKVEGYKVVLNENDVISKEKIDFPFEDKSIDLDATMRNTTGNPPSRGVLAGTGSNRFNFEGFYTRTLPDQKKLDSLRKLMDSLRLERRRELQKLK